MDFKTVKKKGEMTDLSNFNFAIKIVRLKYNHYHSENIKKNGNFSSYFY